MARGLWLLGLQIAFSPALQAQQMAGTTSARLKDSAVALERLRPNEKAAVMNAVPYAKLSEAIYRDAATVDTGNSGTWEQTKNWRAPITYDFPLTEGMGRPPSRLSSGQLDPKRLQLPDADPQRPGLQVADPIGFHAATYRNRDQEKVAIVFEGTSQKVLDSLEDWAANIGQAVKLTGKPPKQYQEALNYAQREAERVRKECPNCEIVVTGHSLGGGLAQYTVSQLAKRGIEVTAYTFNPAALGRTTQGRESSERIVNIVVEGDAVAKLNKVTGVLTTTVAGETISLPLERSGSLDAHGIEKLARDLSYLADRERAKDRDAGALIRQALESSRQKELVNLREEARREHHEDRRTEYRADRLRDLDRQAEYQQSKTAIDIHGNRVRIDTYIRRPSDTQVEHWVLNFRDHRFDYGYIRRTFAQPIANLSDINAIDRFTFQGSPTPPANYLLRREDLASNGADRFFWNILFGAPTLTNSSSGERYFPASLDSTLRVQGAGFDVAKQQFTQFNNLNDYRLVVRHPNSSGALATYLDQTFNRLTGVCNPCLTDSTVAPTIEYGPNATRLLLKDNTWFSFELWTLRDDGTQLPPFPIASASDVNIEQRFRSSEMQGRDIDIIFPSKFFPDANSQ